ncbi:hypothetical protein LJ754_12150 [Arthrobacter sp. zg-Y40]|uniref:TY-Chap2 family putative peptide chaperone n=1 Tax=Arthrobacter sp. zg-Y40 TaxID=2886939 RepID=UPI001D157B16|nr:hypothetical protein [Arthrobacter sp. zg-Y40]MCC3279901.1 hypothetical protein [Arthrobacter sp. zg-Y40]
MQQAEQGTIGYAQVNALSWRVASELARRDPSVFVGLTGYGGGASHSDALMLTNGGGISYAARRMGSGFSACVNNGDHLMIPWERALQMRSARDIAIALEKSAGIHLPSKAPATSGRALGYRLIASILEMTLGDRRSWQVYETEGGPLAEPREEVLARLQNYEDTRWVLRRDEEPVAMVDNFGFLKVDGNVVDLSARYQELNRSIFALTMDVYGGLLP